MLPFIHKLLNHGSDEGNRGSKWQITLYLVPLGLSDKSDFSLIKRLSNVVGLEDTECLHSFSLASLLLPVGWRRDVEDQK